MKKKNKESKIIFLILLILFTVFLILPVFRLLLKSFWGDETNGKRRTYYQITENGRNYYREKCEEWKVTKEVVEQFIRL